MSLSMSQASVAIFTQQAHRVVASCDLHCERREHVGSGVNQVLG